MKVVHIPFSGRNPYQKLLSEGLKACGIDVKGASVEHFKNISFLNLSLFSLLVENWKPDIVHLHWQSSFLYVTGSRFKTTLKSLLFVFQLWVLKKLGIKLVWTVHNLKRHEGTFRDLEARFTGKLVNMSDKIIVHCQTAKDEMWRRFDNIRQDQISIVPHGHFIDYYPNKIDRAEARNRLGLRQSKLTFLFLGELRYYKGVMELIEAFKTINDEEIQLILAGRPYNKKILGEIKQETEADKNIHTHTAYVPDEDLQVYINASDVMVCPYRDVFTSGGIFLALSFGKPIVAPDSGCIADTLRGTDNFVYSSTDSQGLIQAMNDALANKTRLGSIGKMNLKLAQKIKWQEIAHCTSLLYKDT